MVDRLFFADAALAAERIIIHTYIGILLAAFYERGSMVSDEIAQFYGIPHRVTELHHLGHEEGPEHSRPAS